VFEQEPLVAFRRAPSDFHQRPLAEHLLAVQPKREFALMQRLERIVTRLDELPQSGVPNDHVSRAVIAFRDDALE